jgi:hypothetical protein
LISLTGRIQGKELSNDFDSFKEEANGEKIKDTPDSQYADQKLVFKDMVL